MAAAGIRFGSHTYSHQILTGLSGDAARRELADGRAAIERVLGTPCTMLAYPNGESSDSVRRLAATAGYTLAFTTGPGAWTAATDPMSIPRCNMSEENVVGLRGRFSAVAFEYTAFW